MGQDVSKLSEAQCEHRDGNAPNQADARAKRLSQQGKDGSKRPAGTTASGAPSGQGHPSPSAQSTAATPACPTPRDGSKSHLKDHQHGTDASGGECQRLLATPAMFIQPCTAVFSDRYKGEKPLGKGSFGEVIMCTEKATGRECAVKVIKKCDYRRKTETQALLKEVELLKVLDHPNIMKLYEFMEDGCFYYLVTELCKGGELFDEIIKRKRFSEADAAIIIKQLLSGLSYMHKHKVAHRDMKPENILLDVKGSISHVYIIDFGLSTHFEQKGKLKDKIGTAYYIAPEVLNTAYDEKCDVWSAGVILYILLSGQPPFPGSTDQEIINRVKCGKYSFNGEPWNRVSDAAKELVKQMMCVCPSMRITAQEAHEHRWIKQMTATESIMDLPSLESSIMNIQKFQGTQKLAQAALLYMGSKLTSREETKELSEIFKKIDKNGDGQLDRKELIEGYQELLKLKNLDVSTFDIASIEAEVDQVLDMIDFDHNGYVEHSEFVTVAMDRTVLLSKERLRRAFEKFDKDVSGKISSEELARVFGVSDIQSATWKAIISEVDKNGDGEVDFEEFQSMLLKIAEI